MTIPMFSPPPFRMGPEGVSNDPPAMQQGGLTVWNGPQRSYQGYGGGSIQHFDQQGNQVQQPAPQAAPKPPSELIIPQGLKPPPTGYRTTQQSVTYPRVPAYTPPPNAVSGMRPYSPYGNILANAIYGYS